MVRDVPCALCGKPVDDLAGNPGRWSVTLPHDGVPTVHCTACVTERVYPAQEQQTNDSDIETT